MKRIITSILLLTMCSMVWAQPKNQMNQERIKAQKIAYITERLDLSVEEAQSFWPIYNAFEEENRKLRQNDLRDVRNAMRKGNLSEKEAQQMLDKLMAIEDQIHQAKKQLVSDLKNVISPQKIIGLKSAEDGFNRMLMKKLRERRENRMKKNNP